jgi:AraC-like DNA-binding protein
VAELEGNSEVVTVEQASRLFGVRVRTLQRLFNEYVGVPPKWLLRRCRLKEAAARIESGEREDWAVLAQRLGYYDQSHLIRDFRLMLGKTPAGYRRATTASP